MYVASCGISGAKYKTQIAGGQNAAPHQFPWQVGIFMDNSYFCGGSIICKNIYWNVTVLDNSCHKWRFYFISWRMDHDCCTLCWRIPLLWRHYWSTRNQVRFFNISFQNLNLLSGDITTCLVLFPKKDVSKSPLRMTTFIRSGTLLLWQMILDFWKYLKLHLMVSRIEKLHESSSNDKLVCRFCSSHLFAI